MSVEIHPKKLKGDWNQGFALDVHTAESTYVGDNAFGHPVFDTKRSATGELLYQLKYHGDKAALGPLVESAVGFIQSLKIQPELLVPVPPSNPRRASQPVIEIARLLSEKLNLPLSEKCVLKTQSTPQLKDVYDRAERERILRDAFTASKAEVAGKRILLFDDLFRSGATMNAVARALKSAGAADICVLTLTCTRSLK
jgi:competence protein ComFC